MVQRSNPHPDAGKFARAINVRAPIVSQQWIRMSASALNSCLCVYVYYDSCMLFSRSEPILTVMYHRQLSVGTGLSATNSCIKAVAAVFIEAVVCYSLQMHRCFCENKETSFILIYFMHLGELSDI